MAMSYYMPNYQVYGYPAAFSGHYNLYTQGGPDLSRSAQLARSAMMNHAPVTRTTESKPRLAKEEVEQLESEFQKNNKPNSSLKKQLAEQMRVDVARINNWFQNRRAKAKHEARQKEKDSSEGGSPKKDDEGQEKVPANDKQEDLSSSSTPFPAVEASSDHPAPSPVSSVADESRLVAEAAEIVSETKAEHMSPHFSAEEEIQEISFHPEQAFGFPISHNDFFTVQQASNFQTMIASTEDVGDHSRHGSLPISISPSIATSLEESHEALASFAPFGDMVPTDAMPSPMPHFPSQLLPGGSILGLKAEGQAAPEQVDELPFHAAASPDSFTQSPPMMHQLAHFPAPRPAVNLASRRNIRQPAPIGTNATRAFSHSGPKTGIEQGRRHDAASPMRRNASATGVSMPGRITKPISTAPRSPLFLTGKQEAFLQMSRSPVLRGPMYSMAPPTPDTPLLLNQHTFREATVSSTSSEDGKSAYAAQTPFPNDLTRTPPQTPGLMSNFSETMYSNPVDASYNFNVADEPVATPLMASFGTEVEFSQLPAGVPSYISNACTSQPSTPSIVSTTMGPAYFALYPGSNPEYNWPPAPSSRSSPGQQQNRSRQFEFSNITPQDFSGSNQR